MGGRSKAVESVFDKIAAKIAETKATRNPQIDTPQFKKAFSDTKVVDANGEPRLMYHGSPVRGFSEFDKSTINPNDPDAMYNGFWFTSKKDRADRAGSFPWGRPNTPGGGETRAFYLSIKNPATHRDAYQALRAIEARGDVPTREAVRLELTERGFDGAVFDPGFEPTLTQRADFDRTGRLQIDKNQWIEKNAQDGSVDLFDRRVGRVTGYSDLDDLMTAFETEYVAFEPTQIKSATGNSGAFDMTNPDITKALIGAVSGGALSQAPELLTRPEEVQAEGYADGGWTGDDSDRLDALVAQQANPAPVGATHWTGGSGVPGDHPTIQSVAGGIWDDAAARNMAQYKDVAPKSNDLTPYVGPHLAQGVKNVYDILNPIMPAVDDDGTEHGLGERLAWDTFGLSTLGVPIAKYAAQTATPYLQAATPELKRLMTKYGPAATAGVSLMPDDAEAGWRSKLLDEIAAKLGPSKQSVEAWGKTFKGRGASDEALNHYLSGHPFGDQPVTLDDIKTQLEGRRITPNEPVLISGGQAGRPYIHVGRFEPRTPDDNLVDEVAYEESRLQDYREFVEAENRSLGYDLPVDEDEVRRESRDAFIEEFMNDPIRSPDEALIVVRHPGGGRDQFYAESSNESLTITDQDGAEIYSGRNLDAAQIEARIRGHLEEAGADMGSRGEARWGHYVLPGIKGTGYKERPFILDHVEGAYDNPHGMDNKTTFYLRTDDVRDRRDRTGLFSREFQADPHGSAAKIRTKEIERLIKEHPRTRALADIALAESGSDALGLSHNEKFAYLLPEELRKPVTRADFEDKVPYDFGYKTPERAALLADLKAQFAEAQRTFKEVAHKARLVYLGYGDVPEPMKLARAEATKAYNIVANLRERISDMQSVVARGIPDHPLKKNWEEAAFKKLVKDAVEEGHDFVSWPSTAKQVAEIEDWGDQLVTRVNNDALKSAFSKNPNKADILASTRADYEARGFNWDEHSGEIEQAAVDRFYEALPKAKQALLHTHTVGDTNVTSIVNRHLVTLPRIAKKYGAKFKTEPRIDRIGDEDVHVFDIPEEMKPSARDPELFAGGGRVQVRDRLDQLKADAGRRYADGGWTGDDSDRLDALVAQQANPAPVGATHWTGGSGVPGDHPTIQSVAGGIWDDAAARNMAQYKDVAPKSNDLTPYVGPHLAQGVKNVYDILNPIMPAVDDDGTEHGLGERLAWDTFGLSTLGVPIAKYAAQTATPYLQAATPELKRLSRKLGVAAPATALGTVAGASEAEANPLQALGEKVAAPFYSKLEQALGQSQTKKAPLAQWLGELKNAGVKPEELDWTFRNSPFTGSGNNGGPVTLDELRSFVEKGKVLPGEKVLDAIDGSTQFSDSSYQLPGGENYRELLLTMPQSFKLRPLSTIDERDGAFFVNQAFGAPRRYRTRQAAEAAAQDLRGTESTNNFTGGHFYEPNVLAHVRFNDRTGPDGEKVLFIEEIQSDWHQKGRKQGYKSDNAAELAELNSLGNASAIPDAPLKKTWHETALRRMLKYAADNGYDRVAWTTGAHQVDRYNTALRKAVDEVRWKKTPEGIHLEGWRGGRKVHDTTEQEDALTDALGKAIGEQIIKDQSATGVVQSADLRIDDTGMAGFYDKMLPRYADKFGKKYGAKVEPFALDIGDSFGGSRVAAFHELTNEQFKRLPVEERARLREDYKLKKQNVDTVHSIRLTPELKTSARKEGMPFFAAAPLALPTTRDQGDQGGALPPDFAHDFARRNGFEAFAGGGRVQVRDRLDQLKADAGRHKTGALR